MDVGDDCNVAQALVGIYVGKIRHPPLIRMSNAIPSGFAAVSTARTTGMGLRRSDRRAPQYFLDAKDFHQPSYQVAAYGPAFPQGSLPQLPAPVDVPPYGEPGYRRAFVLHMRLLIRGQSDHKPGCDSGDPSTPKCPYWFGRRARSGTSARRNSGAGTCR